MEDLIFKTGVIIYMILNLINIARINRRIAVLEEDAIKKHSIVKVLVEKIINEDQIEGKEN